MPVTILLAFFASCPSDPGCAPLIAGVIKQARADHDVERVLFAAGHEHILQTIEATAPDIVVALHSVQTARADDIMRLVAALRADATVEIAALCHSRHQEESEVADAMKVILDREDNALYCSRARTLCLRGIATKIRYVDDNGLYACRHTALARLRANAKRDAARCLEELRLPAAGMKVRAVEARGRTAHRAHHH